MNPIFIISDTKIESIIKNSTNKYYGFFNQDKDNIVQQYLCFHSDIFLMTNDTEIFNDEVIVIYIRDLSNDYNRYNEDLLQLINNDVFRNDVKSIFFIDVWDGLSSNINLEIKNKIKESNSNILSKITSEVFFVLLAKDNKESKGVSIDDIYYQIDRLINILNTNYPKIYPYFKANNNFDINSFGSSAILYPKSKIKKSIFHLNNAVHLHNLLTNTRFNKEELYNISAIIPSLEDNNNRIEKLLKDKYSSTPDMVHVLISVNTLYDDCEIDNIKNTFDSLELFPFSSFISENENLSTSIIDSTHNDYLLDVNHRTSDAKKETEKFFNYTDILFREYRNENIISFQGNLNRQKKDKIRAIKDCISKYSDDIIKATKENLNNNFGNTTSFEALSKTLSYFAIGSENENFDHDKNLNKKIENISKESAIERVIYRRKLFKNFHDKNLQLKKEVEHIDNELECKNGNSGFRKLIEQRKQLSFNIIDKEVGFFKKHRYSFLQLTTFFSVIASLVFFSLLYFFNSLQALKYATIIRTIPIIIGSILVISKVIKYKKYKKYLESKISLKITILNDIIDSHDRFIKSYVSQIKTEYTLEIFKEIQNYCKVKVYKIKHFRIYLINHYIYSTTNYNDVNFENSAFEYSLVTKKHFEKSFFNDSQPSYFNKNPVKKLTFLNLYINKSKTDTVYEFHLDNLSIRFFDENEIASDTVDALDKHKSESVYHNKFDKEPVLYLSNKDNSEPIILEDVNQGQIGNCYFMASIGAIAHTNPSYLRKMITFFNPLDDVTKDDSESNNQSFLVRFFDNDKNEKYIAIDNKFWFFKDSISPVYAKFGYVDENKHEIWAMILEKAWAKVNDGYKEIVGDDKNVKFKKKQRKIDFGMALSGNFINYESISDYNNNDLINSLKNSLKENMPVVVYSKDNIKDSTVVEWHAYTVKSVNNDKINLYNPHGSNHLFGISVNFFKENFETILFFNLEETSELIIHPNEKIKYIDHINEIEKDLSSFFDNESSTKIPIPDIINNEEYKKVIKRIDKTSIPLYNKKNIDNEYSIIFSDNKDSYNKILKDIPNDRHPKFSDNINLLLMKVMHWKLN